MAPVPVPPADVTVGPTTPKLANPVAASDFRGTPRLVPRDVSEAKLAAELADWEASASIYKRRGWLMLDRGPLTVEVAFLASVPLVGIYTIPVITACVRLDYSNYDLWPPSLTFLDPRTRQPANPAVRAPATGPAGVRDALVDGHPDTGRPFLCLPGIREYHNHPQHTGDDWLLHRTTGAGRLAVICERIWQRMVLNVVGLSVTVQALPPAIGTQVSMALSQGDLGAVLMPVLARAVESPGTSEERTSPLAADPDEDSAAESTGA